MRKRWTAAGMLAAEQRFRRIIGYRDLAKLASPSSASVIAIAAFVSAAFVLAVTDALTRTSEGQAQLGTDD